MQLDKALCHLYEHMQHAIVCIRIRCVTALLSLIQCMYLINEVELRTHNALVEECKAFS